MSRRLVRDQSYRLFTKEGQYLQLARHPTVLRDCLTFGEKATAAWVRFQGVTASDTDFPTIAIRPADVMVLQIKDAAGTWLTCSPLRDPQRTLAQEWQIVTKAWASPQIWAHADLRYVNLGRLFFIPLTSDALKAMTDRTTKFTEADYFQVTMYHRGVDVNGTWVYLTAKGGWSPNPGDAVCCGLTSSSEY